MALLSMLTTFILLFEMVAIILGIDGTWGTFIHAGEDAFKKGSWLYLKKGSFINRKLAL